MGRIWRLQRALREEVEEGLKGLGVSGLEAWLLASLAHHPHPSSLARRMGFPLPTVSHMLRRLEAQGLVERGLEPGDLRRFRFRLTPKGEEVRARAETLWEEALGRRLARLSLEEARKLLDLLSRLEEA